MNGIVLFETFPYFWNRYYAWDHRVLKKFAKHYSTGEEIPLQLVESMKQAKNMFVATELQRQVRD
jgi:intermediate peptidase